MIYVLLEDPYNVINSVIRELLTKFPASSYIDLTGKYFKFNVERFNNKPLLSNGWLIQMNGRVPIRLLEKLNNMSNNNWLVVKVDSRVELENFLDKSKHLEKKVIDNYKVKKEVMIKWVVSQLHCSTDDAKFLCNRLKCRLHDVVSSTNSLATLKSASKSDMQRFTKVTNRIRVSDVIDFLLGIERRGVTYEDVLELLYDFRFAYKWLINTITGEISLYLEVFQLISDGSLTLQNYKSFKDVSESRKIRALSDYQLYKIMDSYHVISSEYVYFLAQQLKKIPITVFGLTRLIMLLKLGGK